MSPSEPPSARRPSKKTAGKGRLAELERLLEELTSQVGSLGDQLRAERERSREREERLLRLLESAMDGRADSGRPSRRPRSLGEEEDDSNLDSRVLATLETIRDADQGRGVTPADIVGPMGLDSVRGIGPRMRRFKRRLFELGFRPEDVIDNRLVARNQPRWFAGPSMPAALKKLAELA